MEPLIVRSHSHSDGAVCCLLCGVDSAGLLQDAPVNQQLLILHNGRLDSSLGFDFMGLFVCLWVVVFCCCFGVLIFLEGMVALRQNIFL